MKYALRINDYLLVESTSNQVNQYGGYAGMNCHQFSKFINQISEKYEFPKEEIILGGDHLGPNTWRNETSQKAMDKACELV